MLAKTAAGCPGAAGCAGTVSIYRDMGDVEIVATDKASLRYRRKPTPSRQVVRRGSIARDINVPFTFRIAPHDTYAEPFVVKGALQPGQSEFTRNVSAEWVRDYGDGLFIIGALETEERMPTPW